MCFSTQTVWVYFIFTSSHAENELSCMTRAPTLPISRSMKRTMEKVLTYESNSSLRATEIAEDNQIITTSFINLYFACIFVSDTIHTLLNMVAC
jgi:flagellar biosynthesis regulator FlaF